MLRDLRCGTTIIYRTLDWIGWGTRNRRRRPPWYRRDWDWSPFWGWRSACLEGKLEIRFHSCWSLLTKEITQLTMNNKPPFVFYRTVRNVRILCAARQVLSIVIDNGDECEHAECLIAGLRELRKWETMKSVTMGIEVDAISMSTRVTVLYQSGTIVSLTFLAILLICLVPFHHVSIASGREPELLHSTS